MARHSRVTVPRGHVAVIVYAGVLTGVVQDAPGAPGPIGTGRISGNHLIAFRPAGLSC